MPPNYAGLPMAPPGAVPLFGDTLLPGTEPPPDLTAAPGEDPPWPPGPWLTQDEIAAAQEPPILGPSLEEMRGPAIPPPEAPDTLQIELPADRGPMGPPAPPIPAPPPVSRRPPPPGQAGQPFVGPRPGEAPAGPGPGPGQAPGLGIDWGAPLAGLGGPGAPGGAQGELEDPFSADRAADRLLGAGQEEIAVDAANRQRDREEFVARTRQQDLEASGRLAAKNLRTWQRAASKAQKDSQDLRADLHRLNQQEPDPKRWYANQSTVGKIGSWVSAIAGGLTSVYNEGGRNDGMEFVIGQMDKDVELQKQNLQARRQGIQVEMDAVGQEYARSGDEFRAVETVRMANLDQLDKILAAKAAQFDPVGTRAQAIAGARLEVRQAQAKSMAAAEERLHKRAVEEAELQIKQDALAEQRRGRQAAASATERARRDATSRWAFEHGAVQDANGNWIADPNRPQEADLETRSKIAQLELVGERAGKLKAERQMAEAKLAAQQGGPGGSSYAVGDQNGKAYTQKDGKPFLIEDDVKRREVQSLNTSAKNLSAFVDQIKAIRAEDGGASATVGSKQYQQLKSLAQAVDFDTLRANGLGAPTGKDVDLVNAFRGGKDVTSFIYDAAPGLEQMLSNATGRLESDMRSVGYTGKPIEFERLGPAPEAKREDMWKQATSPLSDLTKSDPAVRGRAMEDRVLSLRGAAIRSEGMTFDEYAKADKGLKAELAAGKLTEDEYKTLDSELNALRLTRPAPEPTSQESLSRVRAGAGSSNDLGRFLDEEDLVDSGEED